MPLDNVLLILKRDDPKDRLSIAVFAEQDPSLCAINPDAVRKRQKIECSSLQSRLALSRYS